MIRRISAALRERPALLYLILFLLLIIPALLLFPAARANSQIASSALLGLIVLANLLAILHK